MEPKWLRYEHECCRYHERVYKCTVWHWSDVPEEVLWDCGFIITHDEHRLYRKKTQNGVRPEYGLDAIAFDGVHYHGIQSKCRSGTVGGNDLGTFFAVFLGGLRAKDPQSRVFVYSTSKLEWRLASYLARADGVTITIYQQPPTLQQLVASSETSLMLREPQVRALDALKAWDERSAILSLPCGVGKTTVCGHYLRDTRPFCVVVVSPLKELARQNGKRLHAFLGGHVLRKAYSDGEKAENVTYPCVPTLFTTTHDSFKLSKSIREFNAIFIFDEAHNLNAEMLQLVSGLRCLFMTATPTEEINAPVVFEYPMRDAINDKNICDYNVVLPIVQDEFAFDIPTCCSFLASGMLEKGSKKCIVYCIRKEECDTFVSTFVDFVDNFHGITVWAGVVTADTAKNERKRLLSEFETNTSQISIITSVRILDEGIDLPKCDSVCFTKTTTNKITAIQRLCRANRLDATRPHKLAHAYVFAEMGACVDMLAELKHQDPELCSRLRMVSSDYNNKKAAHVIEAAKAQVPLIVERVNVKCRTHTDAAITLLNELDGFFTEFGRRPSQTKEGEKRLGKLLMNTNRDYKEKKGRMADPLVISVWETILEKHSELLETNEEKHKRRLRELRSYILAKNRLPRHAIYSEGRTLQMKDLNDDEKKELKLGWWYNQRDTELFRELREEFPTVFLTGDDSWKQNLDELEQYIEKTNKLPRPPRKGKNNIDDSEARLGLFIQSQLKTLRGKGKGKMTDERRRCFYAVVKKHPGLFAADILDMAQRFEEAEGEAVEDAVEDDDAEGEAVEDEDAVEDEVEDDVDEAGFVQHDYEEAEFEGYAVDDEVDDELYEHEVEEFAEIKPETDVESNTWSETFDAVFEFIAEHKVRPNGKLGSWLEHQSLLWLGGKLTEERRSSFELLRMSFPHVFGECSFSHWETPETIEI